MAKQREEPQASPGNAAAAGSGSGWEPPRFEVIPLDCEISAYAPVEDGPGF